MLAASEALAIASVWDAMIGRANMQEGFEKTMALTRRVDV